MDLSEPGTALAGPLSMVVLRALDGRSLPTSPAQVARVTEGGTPAGVRRALERLSLQGIVNQEELGDRTFYSLNYEHVLYPSIRKALDAPDSFVKLLRTKLNSWTTSPLSAVLFGSAARRDGGVASDVDLLLIRPAMGPRIRQQKWAPQVHELRSQVYRWTGNHLQVVDWSISALSRAVKHGEDLVDEIDMYGILLAGSEIDDLREERRILNENRSKE
jgi:DNA-binding transcriptional ArsR family regulator